MANPFVSSGNCLSASRSLPSRVKSWGTKASPTATLLFKRSYNVTLLTLMTLLMMLKIVEDDKGGFHLHLLVFPFI